VDKRRFLTEKKYLKGPWNIRKAEGTVSTFMGIYNRLSFSF